METPDAAVPVGINEKGRRELVKFLAEHLHDYALKTLRVEAFERDVVIERGRPVFRLFHAWSKDDTEVEIVFGRDCTNYTQRSTE